MPRCYLKGLPRRCRRWTTFTTTSTSRCRHHCLCPTIPFPLPPLLPRLAGESPRRTAKVSFPYSLMSTPRTRAPHPATATRETPFTPACPCCPACPTRLQNRLTAPRTAGTQRARRPAWTTSTTRACPTWAHVTTSISCTPTTSSGGVAATASSCRQTKRIYLQRRPTKSRRTWSPAYRPSTLPLPRVPPVIIVLICSPCPLVPSVVDSGSLCFILCPDSLGGAKNCIPVADHKQDVTYDKWGQIFDYIWIDVAGIC